MRLVYLGDDVTGTVSVADAIAQAGARSAVFLDAPDAALLASPRYRDLAALGVASTTRSMPTAMLRQEVQRLGRALLAIDPQLFMYKVCSTMDSSPQLGSIGAALEELLALRGSAIVPVYPAAPRLGRYTLFGNHFAALWDDVLRLDRHPSMANHPATPIDEADVGRLLRRQSELASAGIDLRVVEAGARAVAARLRELATDTAHQLAVIDTYSNTHVETVGEAIWQLVESGELRLVCAAQELGFGLVAAWRRRGLPEPPPPAETATRPPGLLLAVSGSGAVQNDEQIAHAEDHGFVALPLDPVALVSDPAARGTEIARATAAAGAALAAGHSVVAHTARGPNDPRIAVTRQVRTEGLAAVLGSAAASMLRSVLAAGYVERIAVLGGDFAGETLRALGVTALELAHSFSAPAPITYAHAGDELIDGLEVAIKGGQVGPPAYLCDVRDIALPAAAPRSGADT